MWGSAESGSAHIPADVYTFSTSRLTIVSASAKCGGNQHQLGQSDTPLQHLYPIGVLALCPEESPGVAACTVFRTLPENAVVVTASPSAVTPFRVTPLVTTGN